MLLRSSSARLLRRVRTGAASVAWIGLTASTALAAGQTTALNVTSIIHDYDMNNAPIGSVALLTQSDDHLNSACANDIDCATYRTSGRCPSNCLTSVIHPSGGSWQLLLANQTARTVRLTASFVSGAYVNFTGSYHSSVEMYALCWTDSTETTGLSQLQMTPGTSVNNCALGIDFSIGKTKYKLEMGQNTLDTGTTGTASVNCTAGSGATCTSWTIVPDTSAQHPTIANLYKFTNSGNLSLLGQYTNTYRIEVTNP